MVARKLSERSRTSRLSYLNYYVFHFFLNIKKCDRFNDWPIYFDEFRLWLDHEATTYREPKHLLTYQTKDHCITALNCFMKFLRHKDLISTSATCPMFGSRFYNFLGADHLVSSMEFSEIHKNLKKIDHKIAIFYRFIYFTGCRFNEAVVLNLKCLFEGPIPSELIATSLIENGKKCFGYIHLESQPANKLIRDPHSKIVQRKPLKGRARIDNKSSRLIPVVDETLWEKLLTLFKRQVVQFDKKFTEKTKRIICYSTESLMPFPLIA